jgi:hypothetical protein
MRKVALGLLVVSLIAGGVAAAGVSWREKGYAVQPQIDSRTGQMEVGFVVTLEYDRSPACVEFKISWKIALVSGGREEEIATDSRSRKRNCVCCISTYATLSPFIVPVPGSQYRARLHLEDAANALVFDRTIDYVAPLSLPTGITLNVTTPTGTTHGVDLSAVPDEELEELAAYSTLLSTSYVQTASAVAVSDFYMTYAGAAGSFPAWTIVVASVGPTSLLTGSGLTIAASYNGLFLVYPLASSSAVQAVKEQLAQFGQLFAGLVFVKKGEPDGQNPLTVFVSDRAWEILQAAAAEQKKR